MKVVETLNPRLAVLTHIGHELDVWLMTEGVKLPADVVIGREGMCFSS